MNRQDARRQGLQDPSDEITLAEVRHTLWSHRGWIVALTLAGTLGAGALAMRQPTSYRAQTTLMPLDTTVDRVAPGGGAGGLGGLLSSAGMGMEGTISDKLVALLKSRTLAEQAIRQHELQPLLLTRRMQALAPARQEQAMVDALRGSLRFATDPRAGLLTISAQHRDPEGSARLANAMAGALGVYLQENAFTSVKRKRTFLEAKVADVRRDLAGIEDALTHFQEQNQLVALEAQTQATVQAYATLKNQLMTRELEMNLQEGSVSGRDLALVGLRQEVNLLRRNLKTLEKGRSGGLIGFTQLPRLQVKLARLQRDLALKQKSHELLTQQLELAKIEEARDAFTFQVIDRAIPPLAPSGTPRTLYLWLGMLGSLVASCALAMVLGPRRPRAAS